MVPEGPSEGAAFSAPASVSEASPPAAVEAAEGTDDAAAVGVPLTSWADISEVEASAPYPAVTGEPEDLLDLGIEPETTGPTESGGGGAAFGAPDQALDDTHLLDDLDPLTPVARDESEHVTAEQIFQELEDPAQDSVDGAEPALETSELVEPELPEVDTDPNAAETLNPEEPKEEESDFEEVELEEEPTGTAEPSDPTVGEEDSVPPPPTSPFLAAAGAAEGAPTTGYVQTGHSPSAPSRPRTRGTKGGRHKRRSDLIKLWQRDFDIFADWLFEETGFYLRYVQHELAEFELIWTIRVFAALRAYCTSNQILVHFANVFRPYRNWVSSHGYRERDGLRVAPAITAATVLPDIEHINLQAFGEPDPDRDVWDDYDKYQGPNHPNPNPKAKAKAKAKASVFVAATEPPSPKEGNTLGVDHTVKRFESSSEATHTPSPRPLVPPRPKERPKPKGPKQPSEPPPWVPSLRPTEHPVAPAGKIGGGAAPKRPKVSGDQKPAEPEGSPKAPKAKPVASVASESASASTTVPAPPVRPPTRPPSKPPQIKGSKPSTPKSGAPIGDLPPAPAAAPIPPPPSHPPPTPEELTERQRGRTRFQVPRVTLSGPIAEQIIAERGEAADKSPAPRADRPPKSRPPQRSRSRRPPVGEDVPRADGSFRDEDTEVLRRARGGTLNPPSVTGRPLVLRPNNPAFPQVVINSEGTWVRVSQPPGVSSRDPNTIPTPIPGPADHSGDPHSLPDEVWRDPSLIGSNTTLVTSQSTQILPIGEPYPETEAETSEEDLEPLEEEPPRRSPKKRPVSSTATAGRRVVYARRRVEHPQPSTTVRTAPAGDPDDPEEPEPPSEGDPSEPDQEEGEEEEGEESSEPPCAPEERDIEVDFPVEAEEEAAPEAPQEETEHPSVASPRLPTPRGSVASFLEATPSVHRSRSRHRAEAPVPSPEEPVPVARTVFSTQVTGHLETHTFRDGRTVQVFVADRPIPKTPPVDIGEPPPRAASDPPPTRVKPPPPGVRRPTSATPPAKAGAAVAPQVEQPKRRAYKAPPRPPYNTSVTVGEPYEPGVDPSPPEHTAEELNAAWQRSKARQDQAWDTYVDDLAARRAARDIAAVHRSEELRKKGTKIRAPTKQPPVPPRPERAAPKRPASPKPPPPPTPPSTPKASGTAASAASGSAAPIGASPGGAAAHSAARQRRFSDFIHNFRERQARSSGVSGNLIIFFDWHDTLDCAVNRLGLFDNSIVDKFVDLVQVAKGRVEFHIVSYSGPGRARQTDLDANNLAAYLRQQGLPFRSVTVVGDPVGPGGKTPILTSTGAHIHCDDRSDVCEEARRANIYTINVYKSETLSWFPQLRAFVQQNGVEWIINNHTPVALRREQFLKKKR